MKILSLLILLISVSINALCQSASDIYVRSYIKKDGTYVDGHFRTAPNNSFYDNYSTKGNYNPYTGKAGYKEINEISSYYFKLNRERDFSLYMDDIIESITTKDKLKFNSAIQNFEGNFKLLLEGMFAFFNSDLNNAKRIFTNLKSNSSPNDFFKPEYDYWLNALNELDNDKGLDEVVEVMRNIEKDPANEEIYLLSITHKNNLVNKRILLSKYYMEHKLFDKAKKQIDLLSLSGGYDSLKIENYRYFIDVNERYHKALNSGKYFINTDILLETLLKFSTLDNFNSNDFFLDYDYEILENQDSLILYNRSLQDFKSDNISKSSFIKLTKNNYHDLCIINDLSFITSDTAVVDFFYKQFDGISSKVKTRPTFLRAKNGTVYKEFLLNEMMVGGIRIEDIPKGPSSFPFTIYFYMISENRNIKKLEKFFDN